MKNLFYTLLLTTLVSFPVTAGDLTIKGSDTMLIMNQDLAETYMKKNPGANIQVSGGGSGVGIAALRNNTTDIAAASRLIKPKETQDFLLNVGLEPIKYSVALDGVAMFVNQSNPLKEITLEQLGKIFHGDVTNWKEVGGDNQPITVYSRETSSGTYSFVKDEVLQGQDYTARAETLPGTAAVYDAVAKDRKGIGYGGIGYNKGVKVLKVRATATSPAYLPTEDNVDKKLYPLSRSLNFYLNPRSQNLDADKFIKWVRSMEGQKIVAKNYFALPGMLPSKSPKAPETSPTSTLPIASSTQSTPVQPASSGTMTAPVLADPTMPNSASSAITQPTTETGMIATAPFTPDPSALQTREKHLLVREEALAQREAALAKREETVAQREARLMQVRNTTNPQN